MRPPRSKEEQILVWCGVVAQLNRTRTSRILAGGDLPYPLFILLRHFCHDPAREWTVGSLTSAFETEQPGMTKQVQKLLDRGLLIGRPDPADGRSRLLRVTQNGVRLRDRLVRRLEPDRDRVFSGWPDADIGEFHRLLGRLRDELESGREDIALPDPALQPRARTEPSD